MEMSCSLLPDWTTQQYIKIYYQVGAKKKVMTLIPKQITHYSYPTPLWYSGYMSDLSSAGRWFERTTNATHFLVETMSEGWV